MLPEWYKDDAVDDVELFQDAGHAGSSKLGNNERIKPFGQRRQGQALDGM